jgi:Delta14-sterol reductase
VVISTQIIGANRMFIIIMILNIHRFFFVRAGMMAWLFINLSLFAKSYLAGSVNLSVILYQFFCGVFGMTTFLFAPSNALFDKLCLFMQWYVIDYFVHEEFMTST